VVCRSVCHTSEPYKNGCTNRDAVWVEDSGEPKEPCIRWGPDPPMGTGKGASHCTVYRHSVVPCAKTAEPIKMSFGLWARMGPRNRVRWGPAVLRDIATATNFWDAICLLYLDLLAITLVV